MEILIRRKWLGRLLPGRMLNRRMFIGRLLFGLFLLSVLLVPGCAYRGKAADAPSASVLTPVAPAVGIPAGAAADPTVEPPVKPQVEPPASSEPVVPEIQGLVDLTLLDDTFVIDLRYASLKNFTGKKIYTQAKCLLMKGTAEKLVAANREFAEMGYRLKIWDAYRPLSAQQTLWDVVSDKTFVADPKKGSIHNRGAAVDVTLVDKDGNELQMPSEFDDFSEKASIKYDGCTEEQARNRELLAEVMVRNGFSRYSAEWWHFADTEAGDYPLLDVQFEEYEEIEETR